MTQFLAERNYNLIPKTNLTELFTQCRCRLFHRLQESTQLANVTEILNFKTSIKHTF